MNQIAFAQNLRDFMRENGLTETALAKEIDISQSGVSKWLQGRNEPNMTSLCLLADYFDCSIDELVGRKL